jgi:hypothetical protein
MARQTKISVKRTRGKGWSELGKIPLTPSTLRRLGYAVVKQLKIESAKDFAKRGWSGEDPMQGRPIWDSFSFSVKGQMVEFYSSFYGMKELASGDIPSRKMTWLTQEAKYKHPQDFPLTPRERALKMRKTGKAPWVTKAGEKRKRKAGRLPLIVPLKSGSTVIFRMAPLKFADAWVHPGIAKFNFFERAIRKARKKMMEILQEEARKAVLEDDPSR